MEPMETEVDAITGTFVKDKMVIVMIDQCGTTQHYSVSRLSTINGQLFIEATFEDAIEGEGDL